MLFFSLLWWIAWFMFLVLIHELGHFLAAKWRGVKVLEFGMGIPPRLFRMRQDKSGTEYTLNAIPLGWFVRLKGEDPKNPDDFNAPDSFMSASFVSKTIVLLAGIIVNIFFWWLALTIVFFVWSTPLFVLPDNAMPSHVHSYVYPSIGMLRDEWRITGEVETPWALIREVLSGGLAASGGLMSGDLITKIDDHPVTSLSLQRILAWRIGQSFVVHYERNNTSWQITMSCPPDHCLLGIMIDSTPLPDFTIRFGLGRAMVEAGREIRNQFVMTVGVLWQLFTNLFTFQKEELKEDVEKLSWPVGAMRIFVMIGELWNVSQFVQFLALISLALGIFNLLPIPALDGGRLLGVIIQSWLRLTKEKYFTIEGYINFFFFVLLMGLGIWLIFKDLARFWGVTLW